jgi:cation transport regulator ChaB
VVKKDLPSTLLRSPKEAQETWAKAHDSAVKTYGDGERAHRTAFAALKHAFEKVGDKWLPKRQKGPSDPRAKQPTPEAAAGKGETFGGVDVYGHTHQELLERARQLGAKVDDSMTKEELARAIARKQR